MCCGCLDGKHINFQPSQSAGSYYYNYKGHHSIVLLALVDATYTYVDVGVNGRISDGGVFRESSLQEVLESDSLNLSEDECLPGTVNTVSYVIVADYAFPLSRRLMKPFPQRGLSYEKRIYNYRLSRARRVVENAFGILSNRIRILQRTILSPHKVETITLACCILHNFLATKCNRYIDTEKLVCDLKKLSTQGSGHFSNSAINNRIHFCNYFNSPIGSVEWQKRAAGLE